MSGMKDLIDSLNAVYEVSDERSLLRYNLVALAMTLGAFAWLGVSIAGLVAIPIALSFLPFHGAAATVAGWLRWPALLFNFDDRLGLALTLRAAPKASPMGVGEPGQSVRRHGLARGLRADVLVSEQFRKLQRDLWLVRRSRRADALPVGHGRDRAARRRAEFGIL
jgi:virulence factor BrkB